MGNANCGFDAANTARFWLRFRSTSGQPNLGNLSETALAQATRPQVLRRRKGPARAAALSARGRRDGAPMSPAFCAGGRDGIVVCLVAAGEGFKTTLSPPRCRVAARHHESNTSREGWSRLRQVVPICPVDSRSRFRHVQALPRWRAKWGDGGLLPSSGSHGGRR
jgi:hypothetical protein